MIMIDFIVMILASSYKFHSSIYFQALQHLLPSQDFYYSHLLTNYCHLYLTFVNLSYFCLVKDFMKNFPITCFPYNHMKVLTIFLIISTALCYILRYPFLINTKFSHHRNVLKKLVLNYHLKLGFHFCLKQENITDFYYMGKNQNHSNYCYSYLDIIKGTLQECFCYYLGQYCFKVLSMLFFMLPHHICQENLNKVHQFIMEFKTYHDYYTNPSYLYFNLISDQIDSLKFCFNNMYQATFNFFIVYSHFYFGGCFYLILIQLIIPCRLSLSYCLKIKFTLLTIALSFNLVCSFLRSICNFFAEMHMNRINNDSMLVINHYTNYICLDYCFKHVMSNYPSYKNLYY